MLLHRPFLSASSEDQVADKHISICISTACTAIQILHSAFTHRHYVRTWWYKATHILNAASLILYVLIQSVPNNGFHTASRSTLVESVQKAVQILRAMDPMPVATRYADLLTEILRLVMKSYVENEQIDPQSHDGIVFREESAILPGWNTQDNTYSTHAGGFEGLISHDAQNLAFTRDGLLASLMNPNSLDHLTMGTDDFIFDGLEGWNVAGNICSDFQFTTEDSEATVWG